MGQGHGAVGAATFQNLTHAEAQSGRPLIRLFGGLPGDKPQGQLFIQGHVGIIPHEGAPVEIAVVRVATSQKKTQGPVQRGGCGQAQIGEHRAGSPGGFEVRGEVRGQGLNSNQGGGGVEAAVRAHHQGLPAAAGAVVDGARRGEDLGFQGIQVIQANAPHLGPGGGLDDLGQDGLRGDELSRSAPASYEVPQKVEIGGSHLPGQVNHAGKVHEVRSRDTHGKGAGAALGFEPREVVQQGGKGPSSPQVIVILLQAVHTHLEVEALSRPAV